MTPPSDPPTPSNPSPDPEVEAIFQKRAALAALRREADDRSDTLARERLAPQAVPWPDSVPPLMREARAAGATWAAIAEALRIPVPNAITLAKRERAPARGRASARPVPGLPWWKVDPAQWTAEQAAEAARAANERADGI